MMITIDKESWHRGVRDGFASGIRGLCPDTADPYSYWAGWKEGDAARHGEEVAADVGKMPTSTYTREEDGFRCDRCGYFYPFDRTNGTPPDQCENCLDGAPPR